MPGCVQSALVVHLMGVFKAQKCAIRLKLNVGRMDHFYRLLIDYTHYELTIAS